MSTKKSTPDPMQVLNNLAQTYKENVELAEPYNEEAKNAKAELIVQAREILENPKTAKFFSGQSLRMDDAGVVVSYSIVNRDKIALPSDSAERRKWILRAIEIGLVDIIDVCTKYIVNLTPQQRAHLEKVGFVREQSLVWRTTFSDKKVKR